MPTCLTPNQRIFNDCHIGRFLTVLRQNVVLPPLFEWSPLPRGISPLLTKSFNNNVILHVSLQLRVLHVGLQLQLYYLSLACCHPQIVHHHQCRAFIPPTWTHLQIVSNAPTTFHEHNISMLYDFCCFETHQPIRLHTFSLLDKHNFHLFRIELAPLLVWNHHICNTSKHIHVCNIRPPLASCFFGCK